MVLKDFIRKYGHFFQQGSGLDLVKASPLIVWLIIVGLIFLLVNKYIYQHHSIYYHVLCVTQINKLFLCKELP